jgi:hypothetical protein
MDRTWKGMTAGILTIISGCYGIGVGALVTGIGTAFMFGIPGLELIAGIGAGIIVIGIVALIAGIFTLRRRSWGFALTGAILAAILFPVGTVLGILAIIFVAMGKSEFE